MVHLTVCSIEILLKGKLDKPEKTRGEINVSFFLCFLATLVPIILGFLVLSSIENSDSSSDYFVFFLQPLAMTIPIAFLARWFALKIPAPLAALLKELPYSFLGAVFALLFWKMMYSLPIVDNKIYYLMVIVIFQLFILWILYITFRKFLAACIACLFGEKVDAEIIYKSESHAYKLQLIFYTIKYKIDEKHSNNLRYISGIFDVSFIHIPKRGETIKVWYTPRFGGVSYYNY